jgi:hypothetical protein
MTAFVGGQWIDANSDCRASMILARAQRLDASEHLASWHLESELSVFTPSRYAATAA